MSCTKMGRIRKLIKKNKAAPTSNVKNRDERREQQIQILITISKNGFRPKKKLAVKKIKTTEPGTGKRKKK